MAWRTASVKEQRKLFVLEVKRGNKSFSDICTAFGISRPTGYKWVAREAEKGEEGLEDLSSSPRSQPNKTPEELEKKILAIKNRRERWGGKKILGHLESHEPSEPWPSVTTVNNILKRNGLVKPRKKRKRVPVATTPLSHCSGPNDVWCADFKGWFLTKDKVKCDPFTVTDAHSRFLLYCSKLCSNKGADVWNILESLFFEYGLPKYLRTDNGPPFGTTGVGRLSSLSVKVIKAGVIPEWIDPGKPYQNGRHERMHLTLKQEGIYPFKLTLEEQQKKFPEFLHYFNHERPHEALNQKVPSDVYLRSSRQWNGKLRSPEYGSEYVVKRVRKMGQVGWRGQSPFIGKALAHEYIGFKESQEDGLWHVCYGPLLLGTMDHLGRFEVARAPSRVKRNYKERCY